MVHHGYIVEDDIRVGGGGGEGGGWCWGGGDGRLGGKDVRERVITQCKC